MSNTPSTLPELNAFLFFQLPIHFETDQKLLKDRYFSLQRAFHPDRSHKKLEAERLYAEHQAALANKFYDILKDPLKRALHLLELKGIPLEDLEKETLTDPDLLIEIMEKQEAIESTAALTDLQALLDEEKQNKEASFRELIKAFETEDFVLALKLIRRIQYIEKNLKDLKAKSHAFTNC